MDERNSPESDHLAAEDSTGCILAILLYNIETLFVEEFVSDLSNFVFEFLCM